MKFQVEYTSVIVIDAPDIDTAVARVVDRHFDPADASMPIVLDVYQIESEEDDDADEDKVPA